MELAPVLLERRGRVRQPAPLRLWRLLSSSPAATGRPRPGCGTSQSESVILLLLLVWNMYQLAQSSVPSCPTLILDIRDPAVGQVSQRILFVVVVGLEYVSNVA